MKRMLIVFIPWLMLSSCTLFRVSDPAAIDWSQKKVRVVFSSPGYDSHTGEDAHIQDQLAQMMNSARNTLDICIYELSQPVIYNAVIDAHRRGVQVRFVGDIDNVTYEGYQAFIKEGIAMRLGNDEKIMHNKYILVDDRYLSIGSANFTETGMFHNNENVLFIDSPELAAYYKKDFETMFIKGYIGLDKIGNKFEGFDDNHFVITNYDGSISEITVYLTPYDEESSVDRVDYKFMEYVDRAQSSIYFAIFAFTHPDIADRMVAASAGRGVKVYGLFDKSWHTGNQYALHHVFINAMTTTPGIHVRYDGNENFQIGNPLHGSKCHNKYMVVDADTTNGFVVTGSYNFSKAASYKGNDENWVVIKDPDILRAYSNNFTEMYSIGQSPTKDLNGDNAGYQDVIINEIHWAGSYNILGVEDLNDKFVELKNLTSEDIDISGWQLVGTTASDALSYRILMHIFEEGSTIKAGGCHVLYYSTNSAFIAYEDYSIDQWLYLYQEQDQPYVRLILKDKDSVVIDDTGSSLSAPFAGTLNHFSQYASMERNFAATNDGRVSTGWSTSTGSTPFNQNVRSAYQSFTLATPGY